MASERTTSIIPRRVADGQSASWSITVPIPGTDDQVVETDYDGTEAGAIKRATALEKTVTTNPGKFTGEVQA